MRENVQFHATALWQKVKHVQGGPEKTRNGIGPMWMPLLVSVYEVTSPQEEIAHPLIPVNLYLYYRKYAVPFFLGHPV